MVDLRVEHRAVLLTLKPGDRYIEETGDVYVIDDIVDGCVVVSRSEPAQQ